MIHLGFAQSMPCFQLVQDLQRGGKGEGRGERGRGGEGGRGGKGERGGGGEGGDGGRGREGGEGRGEMGGGEGGEGGEVMIAKLKMKYRRYTAISLS